MQKLKKISVILDLIDEMREKDSWCGETHIQKALYFLQEFCEVPLGFDFILYKHGPFSFDFRDELSSMQADRMLELNFQVYPYGPSLMTTKPSEDLRERFPNTKRKYADLIQFVSNYLGPLNVAELERVATALYVTNKNPREGALERAKAICELKPHVSLDDAKEAITLLDKMIEEKDAFMQ